MPLKLDWSHWFYSLGKTAIGGAAAAGSAYLGTLVGAQITTQIHALDLKQLGFVLLASMATNTFFFLRQSPLPAEQMEVTTTKTETVSVTPTQP